MKKIVPFNNVLTFNTDVSSISAISLEHDIKTSSDMVSGLFYISGEYKITDGQLDNQKFNFELPFDIALGSNYDLSTLVIDIDDFRYELIDRNKLKVSIDLYIDGEMIEDVPNEEIEEKTEVLENVFNDNVVEDDRVDAYDDMDVIDIQEDILPVNEIEDNNEEDNVKYKEIDNDSIDIDINNENLNENNENIFEGFNEEDKYVTYRVYRVMDGDTIDKILEKYKVSKEELAKYNDISDIKQNDKLIIPANDK